MRHFLRKYFIYGVALCFFACNRADNNPKERQEVPPAAFSPVSVTGSIAIKKSFPLRWMANGVLSVRRKIEVKALTNGVLHYFPWIEGQTVRQNSLFAIQDTTEAGLAIQRYKNELLEARIRKNDLLVRMNGAPDADQSVSPEQLKFVNTQSGWSKAADALKEAEYRLGLAKIRAPFDGIVADIRIYPGQLLNAGEMLCRLLDPGSMEVVFTLLEAEVIALQMSQQIRIQLNALNGAEMYAVVSAINPSVNDKGLVKVFARLSPTDLRIYEGMNAGVIIERMEPNQLVIPKSAVVIRSGKPVVFTFSGHSGAAKWQYVQIAYENDVDVAIREGINPGDTVIISGNVNLDHDAKVSLQMKSPANASIVN
jgi:membrane fusion protein, multidrug efflux system